MTGRATGVLLICNDPAMGRALSSTCAACGLLARSLVIGGLRAESPYDAPEPFQEMLRESHLRDLERRTGYAVIAPTAG